MKRDPDADLKVCEAATPGPWEAYDPYDRDCGEDCTSDGCPGHSAGVRCLKGPEPDPWAGEIRFMRQEDARSVAESRTLLPYYINACKIMRAALEHTREYWNGEDNPMATGDALAEIVITVEDALAEVDKL